MNKKTKYTLLGIGAAAVAGAGAAACYIAFNKPDVVTNPCFRTFFRQDGTPKKAFDSAQRANAQAVWQLIRYGEVCNPYEAAGRFYTGHSKDALIKSLNPFKKTA